MSFDIYKEFLVLWISQVVGALTTGDVCGETGVLCYRPQLFTVRTKRLSQLLRLSRAAFLNIVQASIGDGTIIVENLIEVCIHFKLLLFAVGLAQQFLL